MFLELGSNGSHMMILTTGELLGLSHHIASQSGSLGSHQKTRRLRLLKSLETPHLKFLIIVISRARRLEHAVVDLMWSVDRSESAMQ